MAEGVEEGMKGKGVVSPSAGSLTRVGVPVEGVEEVLEGNGGSSDWAYRLQGWVVRRMRKEDRRLWEKEVNVLGLVLAMAVIMKRKGLNLVVRKKRSLR